MYIIYNNKHYNTIVVTTKKKEYKTILQEEEMYGNDLNDKETWKRIESTEPSIRVSYSVDVDG